MREIVREVRLREIVDEARCSVREVVNGARWSVRENVAEQGGV